MKLVIMKKKRFWLTMIVGIIAVIGACKKSDDSTTSVSCAGTGATELTCSYSASGSITGIDNTSTSLSGIFSPYHYWGHTGINGVDNATDCNDNATIIAQQSPPTGTNSIIVKRIVSLVGQGRKLPATFP